MVCCVLMTEPSRSGANRSGAGVVVVCCAHADAAALAPTLQALRGDGHEIDLVDHVDQQPKRLVEIIEQRQGEGLYVLCRSPQLGRERVEELREILLARHVPFARTLTVAVGGRGALVDRIRSGLRRANARVRGGSSGRRPTLPQRAPAFRARTLTPKPIPAPSSPTPASPDLSAATEEEPTLVGTREEFGNSAAIDVARPTIPAVGPGPSAAPPRPPPPRTPPPLSGPSTPPAGSATPPAVASTPPSGPSTPPPSAPLPGPSTPPASTPPAVPSATPPVVPPGSAAVGSPVDPPSPPAATTGRANPPIPVVPSSPAPSAETSVVEELDPDLLTDDPSASLSSAAISMSDLDLSDLDDDPLENPPPLDTTAVGTPPPLITGDTVIGPAPAVITGNTMVGEVLPDALRKAAELAAASWTSEAPTRKNLATPKVSLDLDGDPDAEATTAPMARVDLPKDAGPGQTTPSIPRPVRPAASSPVATAPVATVPVANGPHATAMGAPVPAVPGLSTSYPPVAPAGPSLAPGTSHTAAPMPRAPMRNALPIALGLVALVLLGLVITLAVWPSDDDDAQVASQDQDTPPPTTPDEPTTPPEPATLVDEPPPPPPTYPVVEALKHRRVRALDVLLVATDFSSPSDFSTADAYCSGLEVEGLEQWRLPHVGELSSLNQANMIGRGYYWSSTAADTFGDVHMAWNVRRGYAKPHDSDAVAVCVRGGVSGS